MPEIDYEGTIKNAFEIIKNQRNIEIEYFDLLRRNQALIPYHNALTPHLYEMKMEDQILVFRAIVQLGEASKYLCNKYKLCDHMEDEADG